MGNEISGLCVGGNQRALRGNSSKRASTKSSRSDDDEYSKHRNRNRKPPAAAGPNDHENKPGFHDIFDPNPDENERGNSKKKKKSLLSSLLPRKTKKNKWKPEPKSNTKTKKGEYQIEQPNQQRDLTESAVKGTYRRTDSNGDQASPRNLKTTPNETKVEHIGSNTSNGKELHGPGKEYQGNNDKSTLQIVDTKVKVEVENKNETSKPSPSRVESLKIVPADTKPVALTPKTTITAVKPLPEPLPEPEPKKEPKPTAPAITEIQFPAVIKKNPPPPPDRSQKPQIDPITPATPLANSQGEPRKEAKPTAELLPQPNQNQNQATDSQKAPESQSALQKSNQPQVAVNNNADFTKGSTNPAELNNDALSPAESGPQKDTKAPKTESVNETTGKTQMALRVEVGRSEVTQVEPQTEKVVADKKAALTAVTTATDVRVLTTPNLKPASPEPPLKSESTKKIEEPSTVPDSPLPKQSPDSKIQSPESPVLPKTQQSQASYSTVAAKLPEGTPTKPLNKPPQSLVSNIPIQIKKQSLNSKGPEIAPNEAPLNRQLSRESPPAWEPKNPPSKIPVIRSPSSSSAKELPSPTSPVNKHLKQSHLTASSEEPPPTEPPTPPPTSPTYASMVKQSPKIASPRATHSSAIPKLIWTKPETPPAGPKIAPPSSPKLEIPPNTKTNPSYPPPDDSTMTWIQAEFQKGLDFSLRKHKAIIDKLIATNQPYTEAQLTNYHTESLAIVLAAYREANKSILELQHESVLQLFEERCKKLKSSINAQLKTYKIKHEVAVGKVTSMVKDCTSQAEMHYEDAMDDPNITAYNEDEFIKYEKKIHDEAVTIFNEGLAKKGLGITAFWGTELRHKLKEKKEECLQQFSGKRQRMDRDTEEVQKGGTAV